jgi:hypothetical protein
VDRNQEYGKSACHLLLVATSDEEEKTAESQGLSSSFRATADETRAPMHQRLGESETQLDDMTAEVPCPFCASAMVGKLPRWHAETETDKGLEEVSFK